MSAASIPAAGGAGSADTEVSWGLPLVAGAIGVVAGIAALVYPEPTLLLVGLLFGGYLTVWGALTLGQVATGSALPVAARILVALLGVAAVLAGLILMVRPGQSVLTLVWVNGFFFTLAGILQIVAGIALRSGWTVVMGIVGLAAGIIILASPEIGLVALVWIVAINLILHGLLEIGAAFALRRQPKAEPA